MRTASTSAFRFRRVSMGFFETEQVDGLTGRQYEAMSFIKWYMDCHQHRMAPRLVDICEALKLKSVSTASKLVNALIRKGYLERDPHVSRGLSLTHAGRNFQGLSLDLSAFLKDVWALDPDDCTGLTRDLDDAETQLGLSTRLIMSFLRHLDEADAERTLDQGLDHRDRITELFPKARTVTIKDASHWIHADQPEAFLKTVQAFLGVVVLP